MKIKLNTPIQNGTETIAELELIAPKAKHLRGLPATMGMDEMLTLAGRCTGQPSSVIDELEVDDLMTVVEALGGFLERSRPTGKQP